jgi:hypothetical protein
MMLLGEGFWGVAAATAAPGVSFLLGVLFLVYLLGTDDRTLEFVRRKQTVPSNLGILQ